MRRSLMVLASLSVLAGPAAARGFTAHGMSAAGQGPQTWDHEPGPNDRLNRFQVLYIDDRTCPAGQIKKFTAGSKQLGVRATRECISR